MNIILHKIKTQEISITQKMTHIKYALDEFAIVAITDQIKYVIDNFDNLSKCSAEVPWSSATFRINS
jgi:hypothetical protein